MRDIATQFPRFEGRT